VGYHALIATVSVDATLDKLKKEHTLNIDTKNLNGEFVPAQGTIKIYKLKAPDYVLRPRPWKAPDYQMLSETEFKNMFPYEAYKDENNPNNWKKGALVFEKSFNTEKSKEIELGNIKKWESGQYVIELESKDRFGQEVKDETRTTLFSETDKTLADKQLFSMSSNKKDYQINETVELTLGSSAENILVTVEIEKHKETVNTYIIQLNNNKKTLSIPVTKADLGGFAVHYSFAYQNSFESGTKLISVPYPKTDLEIETTTFRDKLQPGQDETWSFKIKGPKGEQVSAEILASMYDASLDQFKPHDWYFNPINLPTYHAYNHRNARSSFATVGFRVRNLQGYYYNNQLNVYDQFNWFGFRFGYGQVYIRGMASINKDEMVERALSGKVAGVQITDNIQAESMEELEDFNEDVVTIPTPSKEDFSQVQIRKNLQETAFFFPQLQTDDKGHVSFSFTTPEALTKWKLQLLAHTKSLESATTRLETVTQKELMVLPNVPRFLRQGDQITISSKIANLTKKELSGQAILQLFDATTGKAIDVDLNNTQHTKVFTVAEKGNTQVSLNLSIPDHIDAVQYQIIAKAGSYSDGEQNALPVLSNRMLVTETLPMWIRSNET